MMNVSSANTPSVSLPHSQLDLFLQSDQDLRNEGKNQAEVRHKKKQAKEALIQFMRDHKVGVIPYKGLFIILKERPKKHKMNEEFLAISFMKFHQEQRNLEGSLQDRSVRFGVFTENLSSKMCEKTFNLLISRKPPLTSLLNL